MNSQKVDPERSLFFSVGKKEEFQTIQSAIDQARFQGGGTVYLEPGNYYEDLTFCPGITLEGCGIAGLRFVSIHGKHLLPERGEIGFTHISFAHESSIFRPRASNGCPIVLFRSCMFEVKDGYTFDIPHLQGKAIFFDCCSLGDNNGFINNKKGSCELILFNTTIDGGKRANRMFINSQALLFNLHVKIGIECSGRNSLSTVNGGCWLEDTVYVKNGATLKISCSSLETKDKVACFVDKKSSLTLDNCSIESSAEEVIQGSGLLKMGQVSFPLHSKIASRIKIVQTDQFYKTTKKVGRNGNADPLPDKPEGYLVTKMNGCEYLVPYYVKGR